MAKAIDFLRATTDIYKGSEFTNITVLKGTLKQNKYYVMSFDYYTYSGGSRGLRPDVVIQTRSGETAYLYCVDGYKDSH